MDDKIKGLVKDTFIYSLGSLGSKIVLFLMVPLYTNYLSKAEYGIADLVFTIAQLLVPIASVTIWNGLIRFGLQKDQRPEDTLKDSLAVWVAGSLLIIFATPLIGLYSPISEWKWYLSAYSIALIANQIELSYLKIKGKNKLFSLISVIQTITLACLNVLLIVYYKTGIKGYLISNIAANITSVVLVFIIGNLNKDLRKGRVSFDLIKTLVRYSAPLILNDVSWWLIHSSDKLMIEFMISSEELGLYTVASKIPALINTFVDIFAQAWGISSIKEIDSTNDRGYYSKVFRVYSALAFGAVIAFITIIKPFMGLYVGKEFISAWKYVPLLLVAASFSAVSSFYGSMFGALKKSVQCMWSTIIGAIANVVINYICIKAMGTWGAIVGTVSAFFIIAFVRMFWVNHYVRMRLNIIQISIDIIVALTEAILISLEWNPVIVCCLSILVYIINHYDLFLDLKRIVGSI